MNWLDGKTRCRWANPKNELYIRYHDEEWGVPVFGDSKLFEMLILECFQAGLSWECVLNKREAFRKAFDGFDVDKVACYGEEKLEVLINNPEIIRNRLKIQAAVTNAQVFRKIQREYGSFSTYLWKWTDGKVVYETGRTSSELSDAISKDLKKSGMKFVGTTVIYSYLQAVGVIYSHEEGCFLHRKSNKPFTQEEIKSLKERALRVIPERVRYYAPTIGVDYGRITIRTQKTRWGSCSSKGNLNFNCLLMLAPPEVIDSVIVHELCHRKHMNHSKAFYAEVEKVFPEYKKWHKWLKDNGAAMIKRLPHKLYNVSPPGSKTPSMNAEANWQECKRQTDYSLYVTHDWDIFKDENDR